MTLQWHHNERDCVSNHQPHHCSLNCLFRCGSKKTSKLRVTGLCEGNSPVTAQMASNAENVTIWWRHHGHIDVLWASLCWYIEAETTWPPECRWHFQIHFLAWKLLNFDSKFTSNLLLRFQLIISKYWFRQWLGAWQATRHYLNQWWHIYWWTYIHGTWSRGVNTLRPRQNGRHFTDDTFKCIFLNENVRISI